MPYSIEIVDLVKRPLINDNKDLIYEFLTKMSDDEIDTYENEVSNIILQASPKINSTQYAANFITHMIDRDILYKLYKLGQENKNNL